MSEMGSPQRVVNWIINNGAATFDRDVTVSVFETNIRVLGSLLSNHLLASDKELNLMPGYQVIFVEHVRREDPAMIECIVILRRF
jgi:hypothetical protein